MIPYLDHILELPAGGKVSMDGYREISLNNTPRSTPPLGIVEVNGCVKLNINETKPYTTKY